ncbi:MAG: hypothetical protein DCC58_18210 [Chloroflexi bacterium]|nr:MAG: hypothetical protein DCC58_18210 [Chloroflexota bacterium]
MAFGTSRRRADRRARAARAALEATTARRSLSYARAATADRSNQLLETLPHWLRQQSPVAVYRALAWLIALVLVLTGLHRESSIRELWWVLLLGLGHVVVTWLVARHITRRSRGLDIFLIACDIIMCVLLLSLSHDWRGPFWLYSVSAVFWPAYRFTLRGALLSVAAFDLLVLLTGTESIRATFNAGFGGDFVARLLTVFIVAGAVSLTARALRQVHRLGAETERNRIARDLHDGVGKTLGGISMEAGSLALWIERDPVEARRRARYVARISERAAIDVRDVIRSLRQREMTVPLLSSVEAITNEWAQGRDERLELRVSGPNIEVPVLIANEILRMLTELLDNVEQHAHAHHVWVRVTLSSTGVTLAVRDDGVGFDTSRLDPWSGDGHFGLLGARERASMLGGLFTLVSTPGGGAEVTLDLPLTQRSDRAVFSG